MDLVSSYVEALECAPSRLYDHERQEVHAGLVSRAGREVITALGSPDLWCIEHGSHVIRALVEVRILLEWMATQDPAIYRVYQEFGAGKAKLYARIVDELPVDAWISGFDEAIEELERLSHNDHVLDWRVVDTSDSFSGKSIRVMAQECGLLDLYRHAGPIQRDAQRVSPPQAGHDFIDRAERQLANVISRIDAVTGPSKGACDSVLGHAAKGRVEGQGPQPAQSTANHMFGTVRHGGWQRLHCSLRDRAHCMADTTRRATRNGWSLVQVRKQLLVRPTVVVVVDGDRHAAIPTRITLARRTVRACRSAPAVCKLRQLRWSCDARSELSAARRSLR